MIQIEKVENGYIVEVLGEEKQVFVCEETCQEHEDEQYKTDDCEDIALGKMLYYVAEFIGGYNYDKWSNSNLNITFDKKGSKNE
jgi:hypothetical protein